MSGRRTVPALLAGLSLSLLCAGCGPRSLAVGSVPFPVEKPVFISDDGKEMRNLPPAPESARLVFLDFPWCPPCGDAWSALVRASSAFPPGSVRIYRVLFDRERFFSAQGGREAPPLAAPAAGEAPAAAVTTVRALPGPFQNRFRVEQAPVLFLLDRRGRVVKRWSGSAASLAEAITVEVRKLDGTGSQESTDRSPPP